MWLTRFLEPGSDPLPEEEGARLQETVVSKCEAYLRHEGLLKLIAGVNGAPGDPGEIAAGLLAILRGRDEVSLVRLLGALIASIDHRDGKISVKFKIPREPDKGEHDGQPDN